MNYFRPAESHPLSEKLRRVWCHLAHQGFRNNVVYAGGEEWACRRCGCRFLVPWAKGREAVTADHDPRDHHQFQQ